MNFILFGFKRCGKTHFGKRLSDLLQMTFIDTDELIEELYSDQFHERLSCREIAQKKGEALFRDLEKKAVQSISTVNNCVISVGGGAVLDPQNQKILSSLGKMIYLEIDKAVLKKRLQEKEIPSYLNPDDFEGSFEKMYAERKAIYEKIPATTIHVSELSESEVLKQLSEFIFKRTL